MVKTKIAYYQLYHDEYLDIRSKLKPNELDIYLYLITKHPFKDSKLEIDTALISEQLGYHRRTVQLAINKLVSLNLLEIEIIKFKYKQVKHGYESRVISESVDRSSESVDRSSESVDRSSESVDRSSESVDRYQSPEPLPDNDFTSLQTLQTFQTPQTGEGEEKTFFSSEEEETVKENKLTNLKDELLNLNQEKLSDNNSAEDQFSAQPAANRLKSNPQVKEEADQNINEELEEQLRSLGISLDKEVMACIKKHHVSQVQKAIAHIENTWEDIRNPRSVFLYQVPKQTIEKPLKNPLTPEFLDWYSGAIAQGIVVDRPPKTLPLNHFREPMVILPDGRQMDWQRVRDGDAQPLLPVSELGEFWAGIRAQLVKRTK